MKIVFLRSGGRCAFPGCPKQLVEEGGSEDDPAIIAEMAHIVAEKREGPRGKSDLSDKERNAHGNLILLCRDHHKIIDDQPMTFSIPVLKEMKKRHEENFGSPTSEAYAIIQPLVEEDTVSTFLSMRSLPSIVYKGPCDFGKGENDRVRDIVKYPNRRSELAPYVFQPGWIYAFHDLSTLTNPFVQLVDPGSNIEKIRAESMWKNQNHARVYVSLMNSALRRYLGFLHVWYDKDHKRFYFPTLENGQERDIEYKSITGRKVSRKVVWQPTRRASGEHKSFWWHLAAGLTFHQLGEKEWCLSIRPERHLTSDGELPLPSDVIGKKVTSLKARMYNDKYLSEVNFWREFLAQGKPRIILDFKNQAAIVNIKPVQVKMKWPGVAQDKLHYAPDIPEDDLFTSAELYESLGGYDEFEEWEGEVFDEDDE